MWRVYTSGVLTITFTSAGLSRHVTSLHERSFNYNIYIGWIKSACNEFTWAEFYFNIYIYAFGRTDTTWVYWKVVSFGSVIYLQCSGGVALRALDCYFETRAVVGAHVASRRGTWWPRVRMVAYSDARFLERRRFLRMRRGGRAENTRALVYGKQPGTPGPWIKRRQSREHPCSDAGITAENARAVD